MANKIALYPCFSGHAVREVGEHAPVPKEQASQAKN